MVPVLSASPVTMGKIIEGRFRFPQKARLKFNHEILKQLSRIQITAAHGEGRRMRKIVGFDHEWKPCRGKQPEEWGRPGSASFPTARLEDESEDSTGYNLHKGKPQRSTQ